jgi:KaiC/GvpD/RAD55 family RecA-like ATPase
MLKKELTQKSPIRILENSIHGGLGEGNLGVFTSRKGVGKTACLIHVATDKMLRGQYVLHISFDDDPHYIENWYNQVFHEMSKTYKLSNAFDIKDEIVRNRLILNFKKDHLEFEEIEKRIDKFLEDIGFAPQCLIVDRFPFDTATPEQLKPWKEYAAKHQYEIWFSATLHREALQLDAHNIPAPVNTFTDLFSVIIMLDPMEDHIDLKLLKDHDTEDMEKLRLKLDPSTLLIANHRV